ncbi:MAG: GNAT family N-acetyltransferase [Nitrospirae bacterium]|nr:GNAT family N-acetyltransferase [Nitrospirota bacterium]
MRHKESPKVTGISGITGKMVKIRHATSMDMPLIEEKIRRYRLDATDLRYEEFVVAVEDGEFIGFGRLRKTGAMYEIGCVAVVEERRGKGIGASIIRHLLDYAPVDMVYVVTDMVSYFSRLGFTVMKEGAKQLYDSLDAACGVSGKKDMVVMVHEKK